MKKTLSLFVTHTLTLGIALASVSQDELPKKQETKKSTNSCNSYAEFKKKQKAKQKSTALHSQKH